MVDLQETPAVPPMDPGGDERVGWWIAGGLLIALGWGAAVIANVVVHRLAPAGGVTLGSLHLTSHLGWFAWTALGIGLFTGAVGVGLMLIASRSPRGPIELPGYPY